jgi:hypothetical protein
MGGGGGGDQKHGPEVHPRRTRRPTEALNALADAAGGALAAGAHAPVNLPPQTSAVSIFADDDGFICSASEVADGAADFVTRAVALSPAGAPKVLSESDLKDALALLIETLSLLPLYSSGPMCMLNDRHVQTVIVLMCRIAMNYIVCSTAIELLERTLAQAARSWNGSARTARDAWVKRDAAAADVLELLGRKEAASRRRSRFDRRAARPKPKRRGGYGMTWPSSTLVSGGRHAGWDAQTLDTGLDY